MDLLSDFANALERHVAERLRLCEDSPDYVCEAVHIADAHNLLFITVEGGTTDEEHNLFALRDLCHLDDMTLNHVPDRQRIERLARHLLLPGGAE